MAEVDATAARRVLSNLRAALKESPALAGVDVPGLGTYLRWHRVTGFLPSMGPVGDEPTGPAPVPGHPVAALLELSPVLEHLELAGIPVVPFKGPLLGCRLWGTPARRSSLDLDLLVQPGRTEEATVALGKIARRCPPGDEHHHRAFSLPSGRRLELHSDPLSSRTGCRAPPEEIWRGHGWRVDAGIRYRALHPATDTALVTVHAAHHLGYRLHWMLDVGGMLQRYPVETWAGALDLAARWRVRRAFVTGAVAAARLFDVALPEPIATASQGGAGAPRVVDWIVNRLSAGAASMPSAWERWPRWLALLEDHNARLRVLMRVTFNPTGSDRVMTGLPSWADPVTGGLRPLLALGRAFRRVPTAARRGRL